MTCKGRAIRLTVKFLIVKLEARRRNENFPSSANENNETFSSKYCQEITVKPELYLRKRCFKNKGKQRQFQIKKTKPRYFTTNRPTLKELSKTGL